MFSGIRPLAGLTSALYLSNNLTISTLPLYKNSKSIFSPFLGALISAPYSSNRQTISTWPSPTANSKGLIKSLTLINGIAF